MKSLFKGYYKLTDNEIMDIWNAGFISLDTNVLFNLYRYSDETRNDLIRVIRKYSSQLWLTYHSAFEYHRNRVGVISEQIDKYQETINTLENLENDIVKNSKTPHLSKAILKMFEKTIKETKKDLSKRKLFYDKLLLNDDILSSITSIFNNKVGAPFTPTEIAEIEKEGEIRYKKKTPPGYKDNEKKENKYGDLLIWKELINKAKTDKKSFILIIDDVKEDWWLRAQGKTISPRQELSQELYTETKQVFHLYTTDRFLEYAGKTENVKQETINEVREIMTDSQTPKLSNFLKSIYPTYSPKTILDSIDNNFAINDWGKNFNVSGYLAELAKNSGSLENLKHINDYLLTQNELIKRVQLDDLAKQPINDRFRDITQSTDENSKFIAPNNETNKSISPNDKEEESQG
jgi:hypothetical protein